ncbi:EamA family transporter [Pedobacter yulinensis]|uniref:EamA family transporter n=1 Tax=Pedobacter yulinensis TaxID=2126353 RepID=A0A2T3HIF0_9SPHI|nr:EamA family transporter [Pedobacter yulinensis]PST82218.1 EamA family transporter [Pedobacter yulinensis]
MTSVSTANRLAGRKNLLILHATVFIWGFTGILGAAISVNAVSMVWYRVLIAGLSLWAWFLISRRNYRLDGKTLLKLFGVGGIVALHWIMFFHSIKISTVSVGLVCLSSVTLFTSFLEPLIKKQRVQRGNVVVGLIIIAGIILIFKFETGYAWGIAAGLLAALSASLFSILNSKLVSRQQPILISFYEMAAAFVWITLYRLADGSLLREPFNLSLHDWVFLFILGTVCTALAYVMAVGVMREFSAFTVALATNLEPIYGVLLALLIFGSKEQMSGGFYAGATLILAAVFLYPLYLKNRAKKAAFRT